MILRRCSRGHWRPLRDFGRKRQQASGVNPRCRACCAADQVARYRADPESARKGKRESAARATPERKDEIRRYTAAWHAAHPERVRASRAKWKREHPEAVARDKHSETHREAMRRAKRRRRVGREAESIEYADIIVRDPCVYCGDAGGTIEHIVPVGEGGGNEVENLAGACGGCNSAKRERPLLAFLLARAS